MTSFLTRLPLMSVGPATSPRALFSIFGIFTLGVLAALATDVVLSQLTPVKVAFILGGFALLIPTVVMKHPKAYWLFLLVVSIPFDISKWLSTSSPLIDLYGQPASGTTAIEFYLTDLVLVVMVLPWLARVAMRRETVYFPAIGYLFVLYLIWALLVSLVNAQSFRLALFELWRQAMYFLLFVYLINNVTTRLELRSVIWAVFIGFIISAATVVAFFQMGYGTGASIFSSLKDEPAGSTSVGFKSGKQASSNQVLTVGNQGRGLGKPGRVSESATKRSQGIFRHPSIPAGMCGLVLPIVLAYLVTARRNRDRILLFMVFVLGVAGLVLTFSRAGAVGCAAGIAVFFAIAGRSGLVPRRVITWLAVVFFGLATLSVPLMVTYFTTRPEAFTMRFYMHEAALQGYLEHPLLGVGLNHSTVAMDEGRQELIDRGISVARTEPADAYYVAMLVEVGPIGCLLLFSFFGAIVAAAIRMIRDGATDVKLTLAGIVAGLASLATQSLSDIPMAGHAVSGLLWLFAALIIAIARDVQVEPRPSAVGGQPQLLGARPH
jgi:O-Antigen ligase